MRYVVPALILLPLFGGVVALVIPSARWRPLVLPIFAAGHLVLTIFAVFRATAVPAVGDWIALDALGAVVLGVVSLIFFVCALYAPGYLWLRSDRPNRIFCACLMLFSSAASLISLSQHFGLLWVAVEATALSVAPLLYFNNNARSVEATWKYLMVGSVGIALALLGSLFIAYATHLGGGGSSLLFADLFEAAGEFSRPWLRAGFVFLLVGYGTKLGLAPMHTWKPDAYGEAPGLVGALLAGGMTSCAFLALVRVFRIVSAAGEGEFASGLLIFMGLFSIGWSAVFMVGQKDFKRMLAYSSVEHVGILVLGLGIGGAALWGSLLHLLNNALAKGVLFLAAANIHRAYKSKSSVEVSGAIRRAPVSATLFLMGFFAITGSPPFGPFISEFTIVDATFTGGNHLVGATLLGLMAFVFMGMAVNVLAVVLGEPSESVAAIPYQDRLRKTAPIILALVLMLMLGVWIPSPIAALLDRAAASVTDMTAVAAP